MNYNSHTTHTEVFNPCILLRFITDILASAEQLHRKLNRKPYHFKEKRKRRMGDDEEECVLVCDLNLTSCGHYLRSSFAFKFRFLFVKWSELSEVFIHG